MYSLNSEALMLIGIVASFMTGFMFLFSGRDTFAGLLRVFDLRVPWRAIKRLDWRKHWLLLTWGAIASVFLSFVAFYGGVGEFAGWLLVAIYLPAIASLLGYFFTDAFTSNTVTRKRSPSVMADLRKLANDERFSSVDAKSPLKRSTMSSSSPRTR